MSDIAIKVENLSKLYQLGEVGTGTLSKDLNRLWAKMRGKEDPYAKIGQTNDRTRKEESNFVWALKDINFEVKQGEVLGIIGSNGAGKSTLLKILSKITSPSTGKIYTKGRIASLLEVGTGFHPEMTGRENIYLNGAILGMRKWEIDKKFDEIVDFAGVDAYIDTPVKRYSSGMYVRLAFAVAAFLEPEILIVDEVLAVGDAEFQKKCLGRMKDVSVNDGRTVLFVSHNMGAIAQLTSNVMVLEFGKKVFFGDTYSGLAHYENEGCSFSSLDYEVESVKRDFPGNNNIRFLSLSFKQTQLISFGSDVIFYTRIKANKSEAKFRFSLTIFSFEGFPIGSCFGEEIFSINEGEIQEYKIIIPNPRLAFGKYYIGISVGKGNNEKTNIDFDVVLHVLNFEIKPPSDGNSIATWNPGWGKIVLENLKTESL